MSQERPAEFARHTSRSEYVCPTAQPHSHQGCGSLASSPLYVTYPTGNPGRKNSTSTLRYRASLRSQSPTPTPSQTPAHSRPTQANFVPTAGQEVTVGGDPRPRHRLGRQPEYYLAPRATRSIGQRFFPNTATNHRRSGFDAEPSSSHPANAC